MITSERLIELISTSSRVDKSAFELDTNLRDAGLDSVDFVELIMHIEDELKIDIPDENLDQFKTVTDLLNYLNK